MATFSPKGVLDKQRYLPRSVIVHYILREHQGICLFEDVIGKETIPFKNKEEIEEYIKSEEGKGTLGMQQALQGDFVFVNFGEDVELCKTYKKRSSFCQKTCQNFHLCDFGLEGNCYFKDTCKFYHSLQNEHNRNLVTKLNLDDIADEDILSYLKLKQFIQRKISRNFYAKIRNGSEHFTTRYMKDINWEQCNQNAKNELILRNSKILTTPICNKYITNSCKNPHCDMYHCSMPYLWCIAENNEWKEFDLKANVEIERSYSDPNNESTIVRNSRIIIVRTMMTLFSAERAVFFRARPAFSGLSERLHLPEIYFG